MLDGITESLRGVYYGEETQRALLAALKEVRLGLAGKGGENPQEILEKVAKKRRKELETGRLASSLSQDRQYAAESLLLILQEEKKLLAQENPSDSETAFQILKSDFDKRTKALKKQAQEAGKKLSNLFQFCEEAFGEGQEMLILVTELSISYYGANFISRYGCKEYFAHNKELLFYERQKEIIAEIEEMEL